MAHADGNGMPPATTDLDQAKRDLDDAGVCFIADALPPARLKRVREALYRAAEEDSARGWVQKFQGDYETDNTNQRVWNLPSRDPVFCDLAEDPIALHFVRTLIGWPALLSNISANITGPGGGEMVLHADQTYMPEPWCGIQGINVVWCVDDFTAENGATRIVPGSHKWNRAPHAGEIPETMQALEAPAGTAIVMEGRVWHQTGNNRTKDMRRAGIFAWYTLPVYLPQENWALSLSPVVRQFGSETLMQLMGFRPTGFGLVNGTAFPPRPV